MSQIKLISNKALSILKNNDLGIRLKEINNIKSHGEGIGGLSAFILWLTTTFLTIVMTDLTVFSLLGMLVLFCIFVGSAITGAILDGLYTGAKKLNNKINTIKADIQELDDQFALIHFFEEIYSYIRKERVHFQDEIDSFKNNLKSLKNGFSSDNKEQAVFSLANLYYIYTEKVETHFLKSFNLISEFGHDNYEKAFTIYKENIEKSAQNEEQYLEIEKEIGMEKNFKKQDFNF